MNICLNEDVANKLGLSMEELVYLLYTDSNIDNEKAGVKLINGGLITAKYDENYMQIGYRTTNKGKSLLSRIIVDSDKHQEPEDRLDYLATELKSIYPKGKKEGTNYYWADGKVLIKRRLKLFFKKYGNSYTDEQIIQATRKYVQGFNGQYRFMRLLKYFIFKEEVGAGGEVEGTSELVNYIENAGQEDELKDDWVTTLK